MNMEENAMKKRACFLCCGGLVVALAVSVVTLLDRTSGLAKANADAGDTTRKADEEAIRKVSGAFGDALTKGDAKAVAEYWTTEGEYVGHAGNTLRGRASIEKAYAKFFKEARQAKVEMTIDSIRFLSQDTALEEGHAQTQKGKDSSPTSSRYSILFARENGQWHIALLREWSEAGASLGDIDWLIGNWISKTDEAEVLATYEWDQNKKFIHARFTIKGKERTVSATQVIAKDPRAEGLRSWLFESDGGFGGSTWTRESKRWVLEASGVEADGTEMTATNILTPIDRDSFLWQSVDRTADGEEQPDIRPIKVTRAK